ncbi:DUF1905 domain-containing protein [bacterium]|nr:DUF1905 domain-containing protein [bacterium]
MPYFKAEIRRLQSDVWWYGLFLPNKEIQSFLESEDRRVICDIEGKHKFHCALMPFGDGQYFININKAIRKKFDLEEGDQLNIKLTKDESEYGMPMPEELREAMDLDPEADTYFHKLSAGKQRNLIYIVSQAKQSPTRIKKALVILDYLKEAEGKLDFRELNEAFKEANRSKRFG